MGFMDHEVLPGLNDPALWATEEDYRAWNDDRYEPPIKKSRNSQGSESHAIVPSRSKAIGKLFFKTKLCSKFRAGVCPYITNCSFAHGLEELRNPPPNWQERVTDHETLEHRIPTMSSPESRAEFHRSHKGRHCKKFYTEEGCPFGDSCTFFHDEQLRSRESVAISVTPTGGDFGNSVNNPTAVYQKPNNWKTRICKKWETTGYCPFGSKCHFAHGVAELHNIGRAQGEGEGNGSASGINPGGGSSKTPVDLKIASATYALSSKTSERRRPIQKWKGPDKISNIYGDWIENMDS
ncbi:unnamed protein product [Cuscuta epithymum]|uniref:C3H1-type domain-containing protein n=1 Tax=Cuscuta epithymum TaxID=186058 RepID=A0AAV0FN42_9ASTE|nr:unnamed protein product [Cuscuta epithymum]